MCNGISTFLWFGGLMKMSAPYSLILASKVSVNAISNHILVRVVRKVDNTTSVVNAYLLDSDLSIEY